MLKILESGQMEVRETKCSFLEDIPIKLNCNFEDHLPKGLFYFTQKSKKTKTKQRSSFPSKLFLNKLCHPSTFSGSTHSLNAGNIIINVSK